LGGLQSPSIQQKRELEFWEKNRKRRLGFEKEKWELIKFGLHTSCITGFIPQSQEFKAQSQELKSQGI